MLQKKILIINEWRVVDMILLQWDVFSPPQNKTLDQLKLAEFCLSKAAFHHNESTKLKTLDLREICHNKSSICASEQGSKAWRSSAEVLSVKCNFAIVNYAFIATKILWGTT